MSRFLSKILSIQKTRAIQTSVFKPRWLIVFLILFLLVPGVFALGVTPGKKTIDFDPGKEKSFTFSVINSEKMSATISLAVRGDLAQYVRLPYDSYDITSGEDSHEVSVTVNAPSTLTPGPHTAEIVILQTPKSSAGGDTTVSAYLAVVTSIQINVPYPGKYAEAELKILSPDKNKKIPFLISIINRGKFDLTRVRATIDIFSSLNEKVDTIDTNEISIESGKSGEISALWKPKVNPGPYRAVATLIYDENTLALEKNFIVGEQKLALDKVEVKDFTLGQIAKFEMLVENKWSEKISGVYSQMKVLDTNGNVLADFKSPTYDIEPLTKTLMVSYWDTAGVKENTYPTTLYLHYGQATEQQELKLDVKKNSIQAIGVGYVISGESPTSGGGSSNLVMILIIAVVVLVLINVSWFMWMRKKLKK